LIQVEMIVSVKPISNFRDKHYESMGDTYTFVIF